MERPVSITRGMTMPLVFALACAPPASLMRNVAPLEAGSFADSVLSANVTLHGTLLVPAASRPPVVLIIAGSGPTDRDGNSPILPGKNNSLRYLAEALAERGIASLRYDKRGIGGSAASMRGMQESDARFDHFVDDAFAWGQKLRSDRRFSSVTVIGHSEGSLIAMLAAPRIPAAGVVSIAGAGFPASEAILRQIRAQFTADQAAQVEAALQSVARGEAPGEVPPPLGAMLFRPSVLPYLASWFRYDPRVVAGAVGAPLLVVQGTHDVQTLEDDARAIAAGNPGATLKLIPGMNHVLKQSPAGRLEQTAVYSDSTIAIDPTLVEAISSFVSKHRP